MNSPLISVIIPVYKVERYLDKCVNSVLSQTYTNLEIFLVDDGSPDNSGMMCDKYARDDSRVKVIHKKNGGLSDARNAAIDVATGEWLTFIDSDDYVAPDYVDTLYTLVSEKKCMLGVSCLCMFFEGEEPVIKTDKKYYEYYEKCDALRLMFYQEKMDNMACGKIYHRSLFASGIRFPYGLIYEDLATTYRLMLKSNKVAVTNKETYFYLQRKDSLDGVVFNSRKFESGLKILHDISSDKEIPAEIEKATRCRLFSFCLHILLEMPDEYEDNRKMEFVNYVKTNRLKVLFDSNARKKARVAALLSYGGRHLMKKALVFAKKKAKMFSN